MIISADSYSLPQVKVYARFLLDNCLHELAEENLRLARKYKIPLLELFKHLSEEELFTLVKNSLQQFLHEVVEDEAMKRAYASIEQWKKNELPGVPREQVKGADLVLSYSIRKELLYTFLPRYTQESKMAVAIALELEDFYIHVQQFAFNTLLDIQQSELLTANEELKAHQEELQTLNEELRESQEEYEVVNEELIGQIYARRDIEDALKKSEAKFRLMAENASDVISTNTPDGYFTYVSPSCTQVLGYLPEELTGQNAYDFIHPDDQPLVKKTMRCY
jgi:PAS domain-containing protein